MKTRAFVSLFLLVLVSCMTSRKHEDTFALLHDHVAQLLAGRCDVGPIVGEETLGRSFEARSPNSGCRIVVSEREFLTKKQWQKRYVAGTNLLNEFVSTTKTNQQMDLQTARRFSDMETFLRLPEWSYEDIGVDADVECPEVVYPEMEEDNASARRFLQEIVSLLKSYRGDNNQVDSRQNPG